MRLFARTDLLADFLFKFIVFHGLLFSDFINSWYFTVALYVVLFLVKDGLFLRNLTPQFLCLARLRSLLL